MASSSSNTFVKVAGIVLSVLVLGATVYVVSKAWKKGQA